MSNRKTIVLSLGGSIIIPERINVSYVRRFKAKILDLTKKGYRFVIVTGGGDVCREYQKASRRVHPNIIPADLDWLGIAATKLNAEFIRTVFGTHAYHEVIQNPTKRAVTDKKIIVGAGWKPGYSSDKDSVMLAQTYGAKTLVNLSNIKYVYTADPKKVKSAKPIKDMSWDDLLNLTGRKWKPGAHVPFDPEASKLAKQLGLRVVVCLGTDLTNFQAIIEGRKFIGTLIE
ncbi:UMP kinase [Patescibacteria group bacterium]